MLTITQGQRIPVANITGAGAFDVKFDIQSTPSIDLACFGLDAAGKMSDAFMVFFNQPEAPGGCLQLASPTTFSVCLGKVPATIDKFVFTAAIDGAGTMSQLGSACQFQILEGGQVKASCGFSGVSFDKERAVMLFELYRKDGTWRLNSILQGFNEGLNALVRHFGGEVADEAPAAAAPAPAPAKVSLEKKVAAAAPELVSLAKKAGVSLEKAGVSQLKARVVLVLDASGSMNGQYKQGIVQEVVNRVLPLAVNFDDDGLLECWAFGDYPQHLTPVGLHNFRGYIDTDHGGWRNWELGARINSEWRVIEQVIDYGNRGGDRSPVYVVFISDGGITDNSRITKLIRDAAKQPIFWQFIGVKGRNYGILEKLDDLTGRVVDNCNFFALDDLHDISEEQLYDKMMDEFPGWLKEAKAKGIVA